MRVSPSHFKAALQKVPPSLTRGIQMLSETGVLPSLACAYLRGILQGNLSCTDSIIATRAEDCLQTSLTSVSRASITCSDMGRCGGV